MSWGLFRGLSERFDCITGYGYLGLTKGSLWFRSPLALYSES